MLLFACFVTLSKVEYAEGGAKSVFCLNVNLALLHCIGCCTYCCSLEM